MRRRILLSGCLIGVLVFILTMPSIYAEDYTVDSDVGDTSYDMNTRYDAKEYIRKVETYDVDIVWEDLHLSLLNSHSDTNEVFNDWIKDNSISLNNTAVRKNNSPLDSNEINSFILVKNKSSFPINVFGKIKRNDKYAYSNNYVKLEIANCNSDCGNENLYFNKEVSTKKISNKDEIKLIVKPIIEDDQKYHVGEIILMEDVKLVFTKTN